VSTRPSLRNAVVADFRESRWRHRMALVGVVVWLAYEWGIGNETVTPWLLANVIRRTDGAWAIAAAGIVGFAFTLAQQLLAGFTALAGFALFDRTTQAAWSRLQARFGRTPTEWSHLGLLTRTITVFLFGTTAVALLQLVATGRVGVRRHARAIVESAILCATIVGVLGAVAGAVAAVGREVDGLESSTEWTLRVLGNPLLWLGMLLVVGLVHLVRGEPDQPGDGAADGAVDGPVPPQRTRRAPDPDGDHAR
jgi:hypothetical protein